MSRKLSLLFSGLLMFSTSVLAQHGNDDDEIASNATGDYEEISSSDVIDEGDALDFAIDHEGVAKGKLQIASVLYTTAQFRNSPYVNWDPDHYTDNMNSDDLIAVTKTAFVFPNKKPSYFRPDNLMNKKYLKNVFYKNKITEINHPDFTATCEKNYYLLYTISSKMHFQHFNFAENQGLRMSSQEAVDAVKTYGISDMPEVVFATIADESDITFGSYGVRTTNMYYPLNENDTLHVSYKILTIKKEKKYSSFLWNTLGVWDKLQKRMREEQVKGTVGSLKGLRDLPGDEQKESTDTKKNKK